MASLRPGSIVSLILYTALSGCSDASFFGNSRQPQVPHKTDYGSSADETTKEQKTIPVIKVEDPEGGRDDGTDTQRLETVDGISSGEPAATELDVEEPPVGEPEDPQKEVTPADLTVKATVDYDSDVTVNTIAIDEPDFSTDATVGNTSSDPPEPCILTAVPETIRWGGTVTLRLGYANAATQMTVDGEAVSLTNPELTRAPRESTTFTAEVTSEQGIGARCSAQVIVDSRPPIERCWFAVSGIQLGFPYSGNPWNNTFPKTKSGFPIGPGEIFDDAGGVFLPARDTPYLYGEDGAGITQAVDDSFDSIAVAPGMHVSIRDATGELVFDGDGPLIAESDVVFGAATEFGGGSYYEAMTHIPDLPEWMTYYMKTHERFEVLNLTVATSVMVTAVANGSCQQ